MRTDTCLGQQPVDLLGRVERSGLRLPGLFPGLQHEPPPQQIPNVVCPRRQTVGPPLQDPPAEPPSPRVEAKPQAQQVQRAQYLERGPSTQLFQVGGYRRKCLSITACAQQAVKVPGKRWQVGFAGHGAGG